MLATLTDFIFLTLSFIGALFCMAFWAVVAIVAAAIVIAAFRGAADWVRKRREGGGNGE